MSSINTIPQKRKLSATELESVAGGSPFYRQIDPEMDQRISQEIGLSGSFSNLEIAGLGNSIDAVAEDNAQAGLRAHIASQEVDGRDLPNGNLLEIPNVTAETEYTVRGWHFRAGS